MFIGEDHSTGHHITKCVHHTHKPRIHNINVYLFVCMCVCRHNQNKGLNNAIRLHQNQHRHTNSRCHCLIGDQIRGNPTCTISTWHQPHTHTMDFQALPQYTTLNSIATHRKTILYGRSATHSLDCHIHFELCHYSASRQEQNSSCTAALSIRTENQIQRLSRRTIVTVPRSTSKII